MHQSTRWVAWIIATLILVLTAGPVSAGQPPASPRVPRPVVVRAGVDLLEPDRLVIRGMHLGTKSAPLVLLARVPLDVVSFSDEQIVARLPIDAPAASYLLQVFANGKVPSGLFEVTLHPPS